MAKILIVDDHPDSAVALAKVIEQSGHTVTCVMDGREALIQVLQNTPEVVLLDLVMPDMDGPSFLQIVRSYLRFQTLPVVVLTAFTESPLIEEVRQLKVNAILAKGRASPTDIQAALEAAVVNSKTAG